MPGALWWLCGVRNDGEINDVDAANSLERGSALVAVPWLRDPNFHRTVVLIIDHGASGSLGVVLNRPSDVAVRDVLPLWSPHATLPRALYVGGPVQRRAALCVAALPAGVDAERTAGVIKVRGSLALIDLEADPELLAPQLRGLRVFAGYAGWAEGQLAREIGRGDWVVVPALADDVLAPPDTDLWTQILRRQGVPLAFLATYPIDPTEN